MTNAITTNQPYPVAICGAGPVGLALSLALARHGIRSLVLEKKPSFDGRSRATLITPRPLAFFEALGILPEFLAQGQRNDILRILNARNREPMLNFNFGILAGEISTPFALALSQEKTEKILAKAAEKTGLVDLKFNAPVERFEVSPERVRIFDSNGGFDDASYLVGADGAHSIVREQLGWQLEGKTYPTRAALYDVRINAASDTLAGWIADPEAASFTLGIRFADGVWRIIEAVVPDGLSDNALFERSKVLTEKLFGKDAWLETSWTAAYKKHERRSEHYVDGRVILAGDAAHLNSPAGGQGLNTGMMDAQKLADCLVEAIAYPIQANKALKAYEDQQQQFFDIHVRGLTDALEKMESAPANLRKILMGGIGLAKWAGIENKIARKLAMLEPA